MKFVRLLIPTILILIICVISYNTYNKAKTVSNKPLSVIPSHSSILLKINKPHKTFSYFNNKKIWEKLSDVFKVDKINYNLSLIEDLYKKINLNKNNTLFITLLKDGVSSRGFLLSSELNNEDLTKVKDFFNVSGLQHFNYDNTKIFEIENDSINIYFTEVNNIVCISTSKTIIEDAIKSTNSKYNFTNNNDFINIYNTINNSNEVNVIYNLNNLLDLSNNFPHDYSNLMKNINGWVASDMKLRNDKIILNGYNLIDNKLSNYSDILNNQDPKTTNAFKFIPDNINILFSIGFDKAQKLLSNNNKLLENNKKIWELDKYKKEIQNNFKFDYNEFSNQIDDEAGLFICGTNDNEEKKFSFFKTKESIHASGLIQKLIDNEKSKIYLEKEINFINDKKLTSNLFGERFKSNEDNYYVVLNDYFIFSNTSENLEFIIDNYISGNTLNNNYNFKNFSNNTLSKSNLFVYFNTAQLLNSISKSLNYNLNLDSLQNFTGLSYQITNNKSYQINNLSLFYDEEFKTSIKEKWFFQLDTVANMNPQTVYNHSTKENAVIIQDKANKVYYITNNNKNNWTTKLESPIIGNITQGDFFKNNKIQMLFNTSEKLYMLDRYGRNVEKFPIKIKNLTNLGHSLFDYNNTKRYRILIAENDNSITNLDRKGKKVIGWNFKPNNIIKKDLFHFKIDEKDYITKVSSKNIELLAINGSSRINFKSSKDIITKNDIIIDNNKNVLFLNKANKLLICNLDGSSSEISIEYLDSNSCLGFYKMTNQLLFSNNNELFFLDKNFNIINSIKFNNKINKIKTYKKYIIIETEKEIILLKGNAIVKGTPLKYDGTYTVTNLSNNESINILLTRNKILYNFELE